jgi:hypothetical protein
MDAVSRDSQVPAHELACWKRVFLETGTRGLRTRTEPEERELMLARAKIGELMMRLELAEYLIEKRGFADYWYSASKNRDDIRRLQESGGLLKRKVALGVQ